MFRMPAVWREGDNAASTDGLHRDLPHLHRHHPRPQQQPHPRYRYRLVNQTLRVAVGMDRISDPYARTNTGYPILSNYDIIYVIKSSISPSLV